MSVPIRDSDILFAAGKKLQLAAEKAMLRDYPECERLMNEANETLTALGEWWKERDSTDTDDRT